jgi:O-antigen ligase
MLMFFLVTLFITLSRGAIYALGLGMIVLLLAVRPKIALILRIGLVGVASLAFATILQGLAIQINPNINASFGDGVDTVVEQLTLGRIDLIPSAVDNDTNPPDSTPIKPPNGTPIYDSYVPISTNHRLSLSEQALDVWHRDPTTLIFGTGVGSGAQPIADSYDTVQNQYVEILLNRGLVGFALCLAMIFYLFCASRNCKFVWAIGVAYLFQWLFFSGLPHGFYGVYFVLMGCFIYAAFIAHLAQSKPAKRS